ncbi:MAG: hypothetical protein J6T10_22475 [Methanobrevibacter sp.]|nr:hypothetical protein [Methanobrevibacter sp.]
MDGYIKFDSGSSIYWSNKLKCEYLQRQIIVHSILYYELDNNVINDKKFDCLCKQLLELQQETDDYEQTYYYYVFKDFDGNTGFDIWGKLNDFDKWYLRGIAKIVMFINKKEGGK